MAKNPKIESLQVRRDTTENWEKRTEPLKDGEFGYDIEKDQLKMGDGESLWDDLPYFVQEEEIIDFATSPWSKISEVSEAGNAEKYFQIGNERTVKWNGEDVKIRIVSFNHYDKTDGSGKAGIVCQTVNCLPDAFYMIDSDSESERVKNGYKAVEFNTETAPEILAGFESKLVAVIKEVNIIADNGFVDSDVSEWSISTFGAKLFLPAICELWSGTSISNYWSGTANEADCYNACGSQYEYYADNVPSSQSMGSSCTALVKYNGDESTTAEYYWLRNATLDAEGYWRYVYTGGYCGSYSTRYTYSVAPCFCI